MILSKFVPVDHKILLVVPDMPVIANFKDLVCNTEISVETQREVILKARI
jgi:hypothetical protein